MNLNVLNHLLIHLSKTLTKPLTNTEYFLMTVNYRFPFTSIKMQVYVFVGIFCYCSIVLHHLDGYFSCLVLKSKGGYVISISGIF